MLFSQVLEDAVVSTVEDGHFTKDLAIKAAGTSQIGTEDFLNTTDFMDIIDANFQAEWCKIMY
jgi:isocitrate dehydrogenase